ncbi:MAG: pro-sigmaK processing inhibitor BofA family protein [Lachnospiraceae bacterium]|nr:pro-sigmaK processing inhibitor BofA family protein [Lachnospiraceae bacterium]
MTHNQIILLFSIVALLACLISCIKKRPAVLLAFFGRGAAGLSFLYFFNMFCSARDIVTCVGINPITVGVSTVLGIPGVLLIYAINLFRFLPS